MKNVIKHLFILFVPIVAATACKKDAASGDDNAYNNVVETKLPTQKAVTVAVNSNIGGFHVATPALYDSTGKRYPLLVFIHGIGEVGNGSTQLYNAANVGPARLIKDRKFPPNFKVGDKNYSFIVVSPQIKTWEYKTMARDVNDMISYAISKYRIDTTRIYVSGLSMGGGYTWDYAGVYASRIAAIVPICGAAGPNDAKVKTIANAKLAVWAFHNNDDKTVSPANSTGFVNAINALNPAVKARLTLWPTGGHDAWTKALNPTYKENNQNIYEWMLQYSRSK